MRKNTGEEKKTREMYFFNLNITKREEMAHIDIIRYCWAIDADEKGRRVGGRGKKGNIIYPIKDSITNSYLDNDPFFS